MPHLHPRKHIEVQGVVQGVGFRPFVYRIARLAGVHGHVLNSSKAVEIEAEGEEAAIEQSFARSSRISLRSPTLDS
jgi:hydrogenase maturation protein HypF